MKIAGIILSIIATVIALFVTVSSVLLMKAASDLVDMGNELVDDAIGELSTMASSLQNQLMQTYDNKDLSGVQVRSAVQQYLKSTDIVVVLVNANSNKMVATVGNKKLPQGSVVAAKDGYYEISSDKYSAEGGTLHKTSMDDFTNSENEAYIVPTNAYRSYLLKVSGTSDIVGIVLIGKGESSDKGSENNTTNNNSNANTNNQSGLDVTKLDSTKCLNNNGTTYEYSTVKYNFGVYVVKKENKLFIGVNNNELGADIIKIKKNKDYQITGIDVKNISEIYVSGYGQDVSCPAVYFLMKDGSVMWLNSKDAIGNKDFKVEGKISNVKNVVRIVNAEARDQFGSGLTIVGLRSDGTFYDLCKETYLADNQASDKDLIGSIDDLEDAVDDAFDNLSNISSSLKNQITQTYDNKDLSGVQVRSAVQQYLKSTDMVVVLVNANSNKMLATVGNKKLPQGSVVAANDGYYEISSDKYSAEGGTLHKTSMDDFTNPENEAYIVPTNSYKSYLLKLSGTSDVVGIVLVG